MLNPNPLANLNLSANLKSELGFLRDSFSFLSEDLQQLVQMKDDFEIAYPILEEKLPIQVSDSTRMMPNQHYSHLSQILPTVQETLPSEFASNQSGAATGRALYNAVGQTLLEKLHNALDPIPDDEEYELVRRHRAKVWQSSLL